MANIDTTEASPLKDLEEDPSVIIREVSREASPKDLEEDPNVVICEFFLESISSPPYMPRFSLKRGPLQPATQVPPDTAQVPPDTAQVPPDIVTISKPFSRLFGWFQMGVRSTAIRLCPDDHGHCMKRDHDVWVVASTPLCKGTKEAIEKLGNVKYIVAGNADHHLLLAEWKKNYPGAMMIGAETLFKKKMIIVKTLLKMKKKEKLEFNGYYRDLKKNETNPGEDKHKSGPFAFETDIEAIYFSGFSKKNVAWFHRKTGTLIVADLIFNLPANEQYSKFNESKTGFFAKKLAEKQRKAGLLTKKLSPSTNFHKNFIWCETEHKAAMAEHAKAVNKWEFQRIIPCHGDIIETDAKTDAKTKADAKIKADIKAEADAKAKAEADADTKADAEAKVAAEAATEAAAKADTEAKAAADEFWKNVYAKKVWADVYAKFISMPSSPTLHS